MYEPIKGAIATVSGTPVGELPVFEKILAGFTSGIIACAVSSPTDLVKIRMQADTTGKRYKSLSPFHPIFSHCRPL